MLVLVNTRTRSPVEEAQLRRACLRALRAEGAAEDCVVSVTLLGRKEMEEYNRRYMMRKGSTDVLSFPMGERDGERFLLGDVLICPAYVRRHRRRYGVEEGRELELVAVHGILHLLGYDDSDEESAKAMDLRAREILGLRKERSS